MIARVEPLTPARSLRGPFDYLIPAAMEIGEGSLLVIPFGPRRILGVVVDVAEQSDVPPEKLVEPLEALEGDVPPELIRLGLWVAEEYCSTPARGLSLVLPPGTGTGAGRRTRVKRALSAEITEEGRAALHGATRLGPRQQAVLRDLEGGPASAATLGHSTLRSLEARGFVTVRAQEVKRRPQMHGVGASSGEAIALTPAQEQSLAAVLAALDGPAGDRRLLLHGATGSGKTEVYLRAVAAALERGRTAIVLVPEIGLTPQTAGRFRERFGDEVAILHSKLSAGERHDEWLRLRRGQARVCVGPRSAVFAPLERLGLIVVDEEHDSSYKQEGDPRYDARHVAERRAEREGAVLLAGSATPRPESVERLRRLRMPERVDGRGLPPVELVGMAGVPGPLHPRSRDALEEVRLQEDKAIVLLNRRGWSNFLSCGVCGRVWQCPHCDVSLVLHRAAKRMACHHCGHGEAVPGECPDCQSVSVSRHGIGTERLGHELEALMAPLPVFRLDADTRNPQAVLQRFDSARAGVLVGTQMVAKGHDFPEVTLGLVVDADSVLRFPDFRAEERAFALVAQLAGRSGRGPRGGRVIVQALDPGARALRHAADHDADGFLSGEIRRRELLRYPPFSHLIRVVCLSPEQGPELLAAERLRARVQAAVGEEAQVLGPAPLFRMKDRERAQVVVKSPERVGAVRAVREAVDELAADRAHRGVVWSIDVDPQ